MRRLRGEASSTVTREEIEPRRPIALSKMLRGKAGIRIADSLGCILAVSTRGAKYERGGHMVDCVLRVMLDGIVLPALSNIDGVVPGDVYGVEIFLWSGEAAGAVCRTAYRQLVRGDRDWDAGPVTAD